MKEIIRYKELKHDIFLVCAKHSGLRPYIIAKSYGFVGFFILLSKGYKVTGSIFNKTLIKDI